MPGLNFRKCKVGDIVLTYGFNPAGGAQGVVKTFKALTILPAMVSAAQGGKTAFAGAANANHALIITNIVGPARGMPDDSAKIFAAHAANAGVDSDDLNSFLGAGSGACQVFRMKGEFDFASRAGAVAETWTSPDKTAPRKMVYATGKAICSAFQSSSFGSGAKQRAAFYRQHAATRGGPTDLQNMKQGRAKAMFCSMFVIACYQAVMSDMYCEQMLALDAKHTTPMYFDGYLKGSQHWERVDAN